MTVPIMAPVKIDSWESYNIFRQGLDSTGDVQSSSISFQIYFCFIGKCLRDATFGANRRPVRVIRGEYAAFD